MNSRRTLVSEIKNSFQLEFIAYYSMHLEQLYSESIGSQNSKQRDRYTQLIAYINQAPFDAALREYQRIAIADTDISLFTDTMINTARRLASLDLGLPAIR